MAVRELLTHAYCSFAGQMDRKCRSEQNSIRSAAIRRNQITRL